MMRGFLLVNHSPITQLNQTMGFTKTILKAGSGQLPLRGQNVTVRECIVSALHLYNVLYLVLYCSH
jgi:hypothetical protein